MDINKTNFRSFVNFTKKINDNEKYSYIFDSLFAELVLFLLGLVFLTFIILKLESMRQFFLNTLCKISSHNEAFRHLFFLFSSQDGITFVFFLSLASSRDG